MALRRPKLKGLGSLILALLLLVPLVFFWWKLTYLHNLPDGAWIVWKRAAFGPIAMDATSSEAMLAYNMGRPPEKMRFMRAPFDDKDGFWILFWVVAFWGSAQLWLAVYYLRKRAP